MIYMLEIDFTFPNRKNKLIISVSIGFAVEGIIRSIVYIASTISTCKVKSLYINISRIWIYQFLLIINKLSIIEMELFTKIDK